MDSPGRCVVDCLARGLANARERSEVRDVREVVHHEREADVAGRGRSDGSARSALARTASARSHVTVAREHLHLRDRERDEVATERRQLPEASHRAVTRRRLDQSVGVVCRHRACQRKVVGFFARSDQFDGQMHNGITLLAAFGLP